MSDRYTIDVQNFGPIVDANVEVRPLTVFVGPGNTGKSYLATLIYALHRSYPHTATLGGACGRFLGDAHCHAFSQARRHEKTSWIGFIASSQNRNVNQNCRAVS